MKNEMNEIEQTMKWNDHHAKGRQRYVLPGTALQGLDQQKPQNPYLHRSFFFALRLAAGVWGPGCASQMLEQRLLN